MPDRQSAASVQRSYLPLAFLSLVLLVLGVVILYHMIAKRHILFHPHPALKPYMLHPDSRHPVLPTQRPPVPPPLPPVASSDVNDLCTAAMNGNLEKVQHLIKEHPALVNTPDTSEEGAPALLWAMKEKHREVVDFLLAHGADANAGGKLLGKHALHLAAFAGDTDLVKVLLQHGAAIDTRESDGGTALFIAVGNGHLDTVKVLLQHHPDINVRQKDDDWTPLHAAIIGHHPEMVPLLLAHGANITLRTKEGYTPLQWAMIFQETDVITQLKKAGARK